ncbi:hypothetical protein E4U41_004262 [Claviceps citrina]|nr:hypothetical protein E4U41_004262 [Claviceps citrina]
MAASCTNGLSVWDTTFTVQAALDAGLAQRTENREIMTKALEFLKASQIRENPLGASHSYRQPTKGAWSFSTRDQAYAVSDTIAETLRCVVQLQGSGAVPHLVSDKRLYNAVDLLIGMQNPGGGYSAYEPIRAPKLLERLNITDLYENIMTKNLYPECSTSALMCLHSFTKSYPEYRTVDVQKCILGCVKYLLESQFPEGGWIGS